MNKTFQSKHEKGRAGHLTVLGDREVVRKIPWLDLAESASNKRLLARLEAENAQLRGSVVDLMLQTQTLRDAFGHPRCCCGCFVSRVAD